MVLISINGVLPFVGKLSFVFDKCQRPLDVVRRQFVQALYILY